MINSHSGGIILDLTTTGNFCLIKGNNFERDILLRRANSLKGNAILCYKYYDKYSNCRYSVLGDAVEKNGDYTLLENIADIATDYLELNDSSNYEIIDIENESLNYIFKEHIKNITLEFCISDSEFAAIRMHEIGFPEDKINDFKENGTIYIYEGFNIIPITKETHPELYQRIQEKHENQTIYAVIPDQFDDTEYIFLCTYRHDDFRTFVNKSGKVSLMHAICWKTDGRHDGTMAAIQSCNGGIWSIPYRIVPSLIELLRDY